MAENKEIDYMVSDESMARPLTDEQKAHMREIESQPGFKKKRDDLLKRVQKKFGTNKLN